MKKVLLIVCAMIFIIAASAVALSAAEPTAPTEPTFHFSLAADGKSEKYASTGDIVVVTFTIERTDTAKPFNMYAFQNEIRYDNTFFEIVKGSYILKDKDIRCPNLRVNKYENEQYFNYRTSIARLEGEKWDARTVVGSFMLRVTGTSGASIITNRDCSMSRRDVDALREHLSIPKEQRPTYEPLTGSYAITDSDLRVIVSNHCTVSFDTGGGSLVSSQIVDIGGYLSRPADPVREGYIFTGWYIDPECTTKWNFTHPIDYNVRLYAGWKKIDDGGDTPSDKFPFVDIKQTDWYYESVKFAYDNGLMVGMTDNTFGPNLTTTRAMIVTIIHRMENTPNVKYDMTFKDVKSAWWYTEAIRWAAANEVVYGYNDLAFGPDDYITREQMVAILWRYAKYNGYDVSVDDDVTLDEFTDASKISPYAREAMRWAYSRGIIIGMGNNTISPRTNATRAHVAAIFMRYINTVVKG